MKKRIRPHRPNKSKWMIAALCAGLLSSAVGSAGPVSAEAPTIAAPKAPTAPTVPGASKPVVPGSQNGSSKPNAPSAVQPSSSFSCPASAIRVPLNQRTDLSALLKAPADAHYASANAKIATVTSRGLVVPQAKGKTTIAVKTWTGSAVAASCAATVEVADAAAVKLAFAPKAELRKVKVGKVTFDVQTVVLPKGMPVDIGLGGDAVGNVEALKSLAARRKADYAVNGTFFAAYEQGTLQEPYGNLIADGEAMHIGNYGTTIGFAKDGSAKMDALRVKIEGGGNGSYAYPNNWYATFMNRTPSPDGSSSTLFTPARGSRVGFDYGTAIVVKGGVVNEIVENENAAIPKDGFVVVLTGNERKTLGSKFEVGKRIHYRLKYANAEGISVDWGDVMTAVGAGPRVLKDGKVAIDAKKEGFGEDKILSASAARSGIGIRKDGSVVVATVGGATIRQLGDIMLALGAVQGMNLDGGASSGLYAGGRMLTAPGRLISNSLLFGSGLRR